jgi:hypothetical protein
MAEDRIVDQDKTAAHNQELIRLIAVDKEIINQLAREIDQHRFVASLGSKKLSHTALNRSERADFDLASESHSG